MTRYSLQNQHEALGDEIKSMIIQFISPENCLILAVSSANTDLANSDALALAKHVDPEGVRTIGVLTKLDLMDEGTDAADILQNLVVPLRHGWIGIVNRSQKDIETRLPLPALQQKEKQFYTNHPAYRQFGNEIGVDYLKSQLSVKLIEHIRQTLPGLKFKLNEEMEKLKADTKALEPQTQSIMQVKSLKNNGSKGIVMNNLQAYITEVIAVLEGQSDNVSFTKLFGTARINYIFHKVLADNLNLLLNDDIYITDDDIRTVMKNTLGLRSGVFISDSSFEIILKRYLALLKQPSIQCLDMVYSELNEFIVAMCERQFPQYPNFQSFVVEASQELLKDLFIPSKEIVELLIDMQVTYINTRHPDFNVSSEIAKVYEELFTSNSSAKGSEAMVGWIAKQGGAFNTFSDKYFVLTGDGFLQFYNNADSYNSNEINGIKGRFSVINCVIQTRPNNIICIVRKDNSILFKNHSEIILKFKSPAEQSAWQEKLEKKATSGFATYSQSYSSSASVEDISQDSNTPALPHRKSMAKFQHHFENRLRSVDTTIPDRFHLEEPDADERVGVLITRRLLKRYFEIVKKTVQDTVPKSIMTTLVIKFKKEFGAFLMKRVVGLDEEPSEKSVFDKFAEEDPAISSKKRRITKRIGLITKAMEQLQLIGNPNIFQTVDNWENDFNRANVESAISPVSPTNGKFNRPLPPRPLKPKPIY
jgi:hypothetical protein